MDKKSKSICPITDTNQYNNYRRADDLANERLRYIKRIVPLALGLDKITFAIVGRNGKRQT